MLQIVFKLLWVNSIIWIGKENYRDYKSNAISMCCIRKGAIIKSSLNSYAIITNRLQMLQQSDLYILLPIFTLTYYKCTNLHNLMVNIHINNQSAMNRCVKTACMRCIFKIYYVTRFKLPFIIAL
jgi:hypothetical protein